MFAYFYYIIVLSQILSTLQIISHLVCHKPTKSNSNNKHCYKIYVYLCLWVYLVEFIESNIQFIFPFDDCVNLKVQVAEPITQEYDFLILGLKPNLFQY